jgi:hypothetical protein
MADGTHDKVKLNVRVPPDKKQEWKDALDEGETLSSFVRRSVDRELRDEYVPRDAVDDIVGTTDQADVDLSSVMARFDDLQQTVEALEGKFDTLSASDPSLEGEDVEDLAMDLLPRLPSYPHDIPEQVLRDAGGTDNLDVREYIESIVKTSRKDGEIQTIDGTAQKIAREMREPTPTVRQALCYLESDTTENVKSAIVDGRRHWMRGL